MEEEINEIFSRWERYLEEKLQINQEEPSHQTTDAPVYKPLPLTAGPKAITIEEYRQRVKKPVGAEPAKKLEKKQKKKRAGKKFQRRKNVALLYRRLNLSTSREEQKVIKSEIRNVRKSPMC